MAKVFALKNAKADIDGKDRNAFAWHLKTGIDEATVMISCRKVDDEPALSVEKDRYNLTLVDFCGVKLEYSAELVKAVITDEVGAVTQVDYFFKIKG